MSIKKVYNVCKENKSVSQTHLAIEIISDIDRYDLIH